MTDQQPPERVKQEDFYRPADELDRRLRDLFDNVASEPIPKHLNELLDALDGGSTRR